MFFFQLIKCFLQVTLYYKFINNFYIHNSFKLKCFFSVFIKFETKIGEKMK